MIDEPSELNEASITFENLLPGELCLVDACSKNILQSISDKVQSHKASITDSRWLQEWLAYG